MANKRDSHAFARLLQWLLLSDHTPAPVTFWSKFRGLDCAQSLHGQIDQKVGRRQVRGLVALREWLLVLERMRYMFQLALPSIYRDASNHELNSPTISFSGNVESLPCSCQHQRPCQSGPPRKLHPSPNSVIHFSLHCLPLLGV